MSDAEVVALPSVVVVGAGVEEELPRTVIAFEATDDEDDGRLV